MRIAVLHIASVLTAASVTAADWPRFGGPNADFTSPEKGIRTDWLAEGLPLRWRIDTGEGYCPPTIADGRLFLFEYARRHQRLRCLDAVTGEEDWTFEYRSDYRDMYGYDSGPRACPVVDGAFVYILGPEGVLHCLSAWDGAVVWHHDTLKRFGVLPNFFGVGAAPVIEGDLLIVQIGGSPPDSPPIHSGRTKSNGTAIVAFNKLTGDVVYTVGDDLASYSVPVFADIDGRRWGFVHARGGLIGFDPTTGKQDFHFPWRARIVESATASNPVVVGNRVFITECYGPGGALLRVEPGGYEVVWKDPGNIRQNAMACHWMTPIHIDGYLYGSSGRHSGNAEWRCVELATGEVKWSVPRMGRSSAIHIDGHLLILSEFGQLILARPTPQRFAVVAAYPSDRDHEPYVDQYAWSGPIVANGLLYLRGQGRLVCLELVPD